MSNIFLKNDINTMFTTETETSISLPQWITIIDNNASQTSNMSQSATPENILQNGGNMSATSINSSLYKDGNQLINMITSESSSINNANAQQGGSAALNENKLLNLLTSDTNSIFSNTSTEMLEEQLRNILKQDNKHMTNATQKGGNNINVDDVKNFFMDLKLQGVNVDLKLNNKSFTEFFNDNNTTTDLSNISGGTDAESATSSAFINQFNAHNITNSETSQTSVLNGMVGGAKEKKERKNKGKVNPSFEALINLRKKIATKLEIPNGVPAMKIASSLIKELKESDSKLDTVNAAKQVTEKLDDVKYMKHVKEMLK